MPDNLPPAAESFFALPQHAVIALEGADAGAFAQAQFANDCLQLPVGQWQWNAWLTAKGRVIAVFALLKPEPDRLLLVLPDADADAIATQLRGFVFRRKSKVSVVPDLRVEGAFAAPAQAASAQLGINGQVLELDMGSAQRPRTLRLVPGGEAAVNAAASARWFAEDLRHGLPRLPTSQREQWTPQQLSLERLPAFSIKKGCYPGQEIVARTHFLGKAKRGLVLLQADTPVPVDSEVRDDQQVLGRVVSASPQGDPLLLAVLPLERAPGPLSAAGIGLHELPLLQGLQR